MAVAAVLGTGVQALALEARRARARRAIAMVIDLVTYSIIAFVINNVFGVTQITSGAPLSSGQTSAFFTSITSVAWPWLALVWLAYYIVPEGLFGASLGKMFMGVCVVRVDGRPLGLGSVVIRNLMRFVDVLPGFYLLGGSLVLATVNSRRLGDFLAGTTVVERDHATSPGATRRPRPGTRRFLGVALLAAVVFTVAFDYFGRPALVIQGLFVEHQLFGPDLTSYTLGQPQWGFGRVTYPISGYSGSGSCTGSIDMQWSLGGWEYTDGRWLCPT